MKILKLAPKTMSITSKSRNTVLQKHLLEQTYVDTIGIWLQKEKYENILAPYGIDGQSTIEVLFPEFQKGSWHIYGEVPSCPE